MFGNINTVKEAKNLRKQAFAALDRGKAGPKTMRVDVNTLIDICIAFEHVSKGDYENMEHVVENAKDTVSKMKDYLDELEDVLKLDTEDNEFDKKVQEIINKIRFA